MALLEWKESYAIGHPGVDHEHRSLIELINRSHAELEAGARIEDFLGEIYARISGHFALEEKLMRAAGYDEYAGHKADHERLLDQIRDLMDIYEDGEAVDLERFAASLGRWFGAHFQEKDARLHARLPG